MVMEGTSFYGLKHELFDLGKSKGGRSSVGDALAVRRQQARPRGARGSRSAYFSGGITGILHAVSPCQVL